ncbi:MAG: hypothetical protein ABFS86_02590 [Planctomycetota bacterium]
MKALFRRPGADQAEPAVQVEPVEPVEPAPPADAPAAVGKGISVFDVADAFLRANAQRTQWPVHALIAAGATDLASDHEVLAACEKIEKHGYQYPLNPTIRSLLDGSGDLLAFLRWQAANDVPVTEYEHERKIRDLVERFRSDR